MEWTLSRHRIRENVTFILSSGDNTKGTGSKNEERVEGVQECVAFIKGTLRF